MQVTHDHSQLTRFQPSIWRSGEMARHFCGKWEDTKRGRPHVNGQGRRVEVQHTMSIFSTQAPEIKQTTVGSPLHYVPDVSTTCFACNNPYLFASILTPNILLYKIWRKSPSLLPSQISGILINLFRFLKSVTMQLAEFRISCKYSTFQFLTFFHLFHRLWLTNCLN